MVRFEDGPRAEVDVEVPAPPDEVWPHVADIGLSPRHSDENVRTEWLDGVTEPAVGARFAGFNESGEFRWTTTCTVVACDEPRRFAWVVEDPEDPVGTWGFDLEPTEEGTRLRQWVELGPGPSGLTAAIARNPDREEQIVARRLEALATSMRRNVEGVRAAFSDDGPSGPGPRR